MKKELKENLYKENEVVLYQNGERFEIGIVKEVLAIVHIFGKDTQISKKILEDSLCYTNLSEDNIRYAYRVWYNTGDTTSLTDEDLLHKIENAYAFTILRKQADKNIDAPLTCRSIATMILSDTMLYGDMYYKLEDWLTNKLEGYNPELPIGIDGEYLKCALRIEVKDYLDMSDEEYTDEDVENIITILFDITNESVLNNELIEEEVYKYSLHKEEK